jgi:hypothetical protein
MSRWLLSNRDAFNRFIHRKMLTPNDFADLAQVEARLLALQDHYAEIAAPFEWKFTTTDLHDLLARSADHDHQPFAQAA